MTAAGNHYEYHTDISGNQIRYRELVLTNSPHFAVLASMNDLSTSLEAPIEQITIVSYMHVNWPDLCLRLPEPGEVCQKKVTPGWLIFLSSSGEVFEYHSNHNGQIIRSAHHFGDSS